MVYNMLTRNLCSLAWGGISCLLRVECIALMRILFLSMHALIDLPIEALQLLALNWGI